MSVVGEIVIAKLAFYDIENLPIKEFMISLRQLLIAGYLLLFLL